MNIVLKYGKLMSLRFVWDCVYYCGLVEKQILGLNFFEMLCLCVFLIVVGICVLYVVLVNQLKKFWLVMRFIFLSYFYYVDFCGFVLFEIMYVSLYQLC